MKKIVNNVENEYRLVDDVNVVNGFNSLNDIWYREKYKDETDEEFKERVIEKLKSLDGIVRLY